MRYKIGEILIDLGYADESAVGRALEIQHNNSNGMKKLGEILVHNNSLTDDDLLRALSKQFDIPVLSKENLPDAVCIERISFDFLRENLILPLGIAENILSIAVSDPTNRSAVESLKSSFDYGLKVFLAERSVVLDHLNKLYNSKNAVMQRLIEGVTEEEPLSERPSEISHLRDLAQEEGIIKLVNIMIDNAISENASDIHLEPQEDGVRVRYRIDGMLHDREMLPVRTQAAVSSRIKLLAHMNIAERRLPQDGRIRGKFADNNIDIRVSTIPTVYGESIVMRLLDRDASFLNLEDLGFDSALRGNYESLIKKPHGMILITGPTGSGKTTTLYASLEKINSAEKKIITIEEPVEYLLRGINQIQVKPKIGLTFAGGLRHIVRQDPDVIMVGEIRDMETAGIAIHAALTGHLLFSTLHTNDASSAVTRLTDIGAEKYLIASTLIAVMAQRLVRKICPVCRDAYEVPDDIAGELGSDIGTLWKGNGCDNCMQTGYKGRIAIAELLLIDEKIRDLLMSDANSREIRDRAVSFGMKTLKDNGLDKVMRGITTIDEVLRVTQAET